MPIYEFGCDKCGHEFEELVFNEDAPICPKCGARETRKLISVCARRPKASGGDYAPASGGGGCAGCSGGNCGSCGR